MKFVGDYTDCVTVNSWVWVITLWEIWKWKKNKPSSKIQELSMQIKKKKSPRKEEEEIKYEIPEFRNRRKKQEAVSRKKDWLLKLMENLSIWKNPEDFASMCWIFTWMCSNAFSEPWWSGGKIILEKCIKKKKSEFTFKAVWSPAKKGDPGSGSWCSSSCSQLIAKFPLTLVS